MKINPLNYVSNSSDFKFAKKQLEKGSFELSQYNSLPKTYPSNYYLSFTARVDKGLERFFEQNKDTMPQSVKKYIETLPLQQKSTLTPLEAQQNAFEYLSICDNVDEVKQIYHDEPLFQNLKSASETKAKNGILYDLRLCSDDIKQMDEPLFKTGENDLSLYIVKKIFLEGKNLNEINEDIDNDILPILKDKDKNYITYSTCRALGVQFPKREYINSLRYTKEGYSDLIGGKISSAYENLTPEEKQERKEKIIASRNLEAHHTQNSTTSAPRAVSDETRKKLSDAAKARFEAMTPEEKTSFIEKLQTGSYEQRIVMINAWNKCDDVRNALSSYLSSSLKVSSPEEKIYTKHGFSSKMSEALSAFWTEHPDYAQKLGSFISQSYDEVQEAKENGTLNEMQKNAKEQSEKIKLEIRQQRQREKEELIVAGMLQYENEDPLCPEDWAYEVCAALVSGKDVIEYVKENNNLVLNREYAILTEISDCLVNKEDLVDINMMTQDEIGLLNKKLAQGELEIECTTDGALKTFKFKKSPDVKKNKRKL